MFSKTCWTRFWSFKVIWCGKQGTAFTHPAVVKQDWNSYLGIITQASCRGFIEFKYRNTFAALAKYKFSLMFPDVTEDLHCIYRACVCVRLCAYVCVCECCSIILLYSMPERTGIETCCSPPLLQPWCFWWEVFWIMRVHRVLATYLEY